MESFLTPTCHAPPTTPPSSPLIRTSDQVKSAAQAAGLANTEGPVQLLKFSSKLNYDDYKLLEVPPQVISSLSKGERFVDVGFHVASSGYIGN